MSDVETPMTEDTAEPQDAPEPQDAQPEAPSDWESGDERLELDGDQLRVDVEGFEIEVMKGADNTITRCEPILLLEAPDEPTTSFLRARGYERYAFRDGRFLSGEAGTPNTYFMTESKRELVRDRPAS